MNRHQPNAQPRIIAPQQAGQAAAVTELAGAIVNGALAVIPTETVYGLVADPRIAGSEARIFAAKERDPRKPLPFLADSLEAVLAYGAQMTAVERRLAACFWPGPLTLILRTETSSGAVTDEGFRVPDYAATREILARCGIPLRSTSANLSGEPPALTAQAALAVLGNRIDIVFDTGTVPGGVPSTVVQVRSDGPHILREGAIPAATISAACAPGTLSADAAGGPPCP